MTTKAEIEALLIQRAAMLSTLTETIVSFASAWALLNQTNAKLTASWRGIPGGCLTHPRDLELALEEELFRVSGRKYTLPGARSTDWMFTDQPEKLRPMADKLAEANVALLRMLEKITNPEAAPVAVAPPIPLTPKPEDDVLQAAEPQTVRADAIPRKTVKLM